MNEYAQAAAPGGQSLRQINRAPNPSLEQRLEHMQRAVERLQKVRAGLDSIADRLSMEPAAPSSGKVSQPPTDLSARFGEAINCMHDNIEDVERLLNRLNSALFEQSPSPAICGR